jgi:signal transduction histidine kinase
VSELAKLAREAMRNAIRHGRARAIIVQLKDAGQAFGEVAEPTAA